jgi:hypothetical protein
MKKKTAPESSSSFADELNRLMESADPPVSLGDLAKKLGASYEYSRRLVRGLSVPSKHFIVSISHLFGVDAEELEQLAKRDRMKAQFGADAMIPDSLNPEVEPFNRSWHLLNDAQKDALLGMLKQFLSSNRKKGA